MKRILSIIVSLAILGVIYWKIGPENRAQLVSAFRGCDPLWMTLSLAMVVPLTLCTSWRLQQLMPKRGQLGFGEANRLILVASVLNMILPSKGGDIAKAFFMKDRSGLSASLALSLVVFEKSCDMLSLLLWCVFGLALYPNRDAVFLWMTLAVAGMLGFGLLLLGSMAFANFFFLIGARFAPGKLKAKFESFGASWGEMHAYFWSSKARLAKVATTSVFIWFLHLLQIWLFILALRASVPFLTNLALSPLAILAGLLPVPTFGGAGTRDGALVALYAPYFAAPTALALGLLCTARYILPAIGGLPFVGTYLVKLKGESAEMSPAPGPAVGGEAKKRQSLAMRMFWYLAGGALSYAANIGVFGLLRWRIGFSEEIAYAISLALVMGLNFAWSYLVNFRTETGLRSCLPRYALTQALAYCFNYATTQVLFECFRGKEKLVILATAMMVAGLKFLSYHYWVFPRGTRDSAEG
jgi:uncharacterized protein (TIRG00374 family)